ncbi:MAG: hypothetical protein SGARI_000658, partial [Bacillariaceae sp.]
PSSAASSSKRGPLSAPTRRGSIDQQAGARITARTGPLEVPTRRESIDEDELTRRAALEASISEVDFEDSDSDVEEIDPGEKQAQDPDDSVSTFGIRKDLTPPSMPVRKSSKEGVSETVPRSRSAAIRLAKVQGTVAPVHSSFPTRTTSTRSSPYHPLLSAPTLPIQRSNSMPLPQMHTRKLAARIDRILRGHLDTTLQADSREQQQQLHESL